MDSLYIVIPAYNEAENIEKVIDEWYPIVEKHPGGGKSRLVIIDDGSKDSTYDIMCSCAKERPLLCPLTQKNKGHGPTLLKGYRYALEQGADYIFQTDSDRQTLPEEFEQFWEQRKQYDMLIGQRTYRKDGWSRIMVTKVLKLVIAVMFRTVIADANTPYRLMPSESLKKILAYIPQDCALTNVYVAVVFQKKKYRIKYIPITFRERQGGTNFINPKRICRIGIQAVKDFHVLNRKIRKGVERK